MAVPVIYYVRHGQTEWNAAGRLQGHRDIPLNERGRQQALAAALVLRDLLTKRQLQAQRLPFVASPLGRARQTMELLRGGLDLAPGDYGLDDRLREVAYGDWEGSTLTEARAISPEIFAARERDKWSVAPPGGESYADLTKRVRGWLATLTGDTVVVAHGGTMRAVMVELGLIEPRAAVDLFIEQGVVYLFAGGTWSRHG
ncbi:histidine phosphatase family protein [Bradyrhizobium sp. WD16]|uniref:histidine phosphatase family protein n=1 Tax=Bradyrhizobium sp. WD16 TaxID=1521768 RepID=UPI0020A5B780|nr:histidine phosphatase family protein [Bradyrhizobium sp. WD16]UTD25613.1 histidine phosphatase family protein [Bradyrhizobium sp. WD16]